ncbi:MAG: lysophospholipid acyltransferase family protein [Leptonema sp. (in: bacteria)]
MKKFLKRILENLALFLIPLYLRFVVKTSKIIYINKDKFNEYIKKNEPFILSAWHCNFFAGVILIENLNFHILISQSRDGDLIDCIVKKFKNTSVRGSTSKGGIQALKILIKLAKEKKRIVITPDGPKGPVFKIQDGLITLASKTGLPIIAFHFESVKQKIANSWDRTRIPYPFNQIVISYSNPIFVPSNLSEEEFEFYRKHLEEEMMKNLKKAEEERNALLYPLNKK